jgi:hypothetical protein
VNREVWQNRQSEGNKAASRLFTASPTIRGACGLPFGMLSQLLLKTGLLWKRQGAANSRVAEEISAPVRSFVEISIYQLESSQPHRTRSPLVPAAAFAATVTIRVTQPE